jgi:stress response protein YsnF
MLETRMAETPGISEETIQLAEERLLIGKRLVTTGRVRVQVRTQEDIVEAKATLVDRNVEIRRVPIGREVTEVPVPRQEGDCTIVPIFEEVLVVEKRLVLIEEVHIRQVVSETEVTQPMTLRRQHAEVERTDASANTTLKE